MQPPATVKPPPKPAQPVGNHGRTSGTGVQQDVTARPPQGGTPAPQNTTFTTPQSPLPQNNARMTTNQALTVADRFLGPGYKDMGGGRFLSADGTRQVRMGNDDIMGLHAGGRHINLETGRSVILHDGRISFVVDPRGNIHVFLTD